ncbi:hypothetical protein HPB47_016449 [Ixodes persulcatus]|uniref:Uncharacterized protein n=1 Tax=Ixodes persulcatus TaxID=34615 RepID=A0AC60QQV8_IXOPE|nr:hypothetical protein HPB47_016449 [Ixodes persulcatus]
MSLKRNLYFDVKRDLVHGYADNGTKRSSETASYVLVVLLSGVSKQWIQPLSFILASKKLNPEDLEKMIIDIIQDLGSGGVLVKAVICDQGGSNHTMATKLGVTPDHPFFVVILANPTTCADFLQTLQRLNQAGMMSQPIWTTTCAAQAHVTAPSALQAHYPMTPSGLLPTARFPTHWPQEPAVPQVYSSDPQLEKIMTSLQTAGLAEEH